MAETALGQECEWPQFQPVQGPRNTPHTPRPHCRWVEPAPPGPALQTWAFCPSGCEGPPLATQTHLTWGLSWKVGSPLVGAWALWQKSHSPGDCPRAPFHDFLGGPFVLWVPVGAGREGSTGVHLLPPRPDRKVKARTEGAGASGWSPGRCLPWGVVSGGPFRSEEVGVHPVPHKPRRQDSNWLIVCLL